MTDREGDRWVSAYTLGVSNGLAGGFFAAAWLREELMMGVAVLAILLLVIGVTMQE